MGETEGKLGLVLTDGAMLSKSLIQFSVDGWSCLPSLLFQFSSVQFISVFQLCPTLCNPMNRRHARPPCPSPSPGVQPNTCPSSRWCHPTISSSVIPFFSYLQSFPASGSLQMSQFFTSGGRSIGISAPASILPMNIQNWFPLGWTGWISCSLRASQEFSPTPQFRSISSLVLSFLYSPNLTSIHDCWKNHSFD